MMATSLPPQRYVSDYLTHFVGKGLTEGQQYALLLEIIRTGKLRSADSDITWGVLQNGGPEGWILRRTNRVEYTRRLSENEKYRSAVVCLCDIPEEDLWFHARKYSGFGLAFRKEFLIRQGATPVFYIASQSSTQEASSRPGEFDRKQSRADFFDVAEMDYCRNVTQTYPRPTAESARRSSSSAGRLLEGYVFPFMKFFDAAKTDHDPQNFYMEREWRLLGVATFELADIARVYVPPCFAPRVVADAGVDASLVRSCTVPSAEDAGEPPH